MGSFVCNLSSGSDAVDYGNYAFGESAAAATTDSVASTILGLPLLAAATAADACGEPPAKAPPQPSSSMNGGGTRT